MTSATIVNNIYEFIDKSKVTYARSLIKGYMRVTDDRTGIIKRLNEKQKIIYDIDSFEELTGIGRY